MYLENDKYEILTPSGYRPFEGIRKIDKSQYFHITLNTGKSIYCSIDHPFMLDGIPILANELNRGTKIDSKFDIWVADIKLIDDEIELFDIIDVTGGNIFNTDNIVSHNCSFLQSGRSVIDGMIIEKCRKKHERDPIEKRGIDNNLWIYKPPVYDGSVTYLVSADVARGDGSDYSALHVLEIETLEQVAEYKGLLSTTEFGNLCVNVAQEYNNALLVIENNNIGWAAIQQVINREYDNLFYTSKDLKYVDVEHQVNNKINSEERKMIPGFSTTVKTKPLIVAKLVEFFEDETLSLHSSRVFSELLTFIWNGTKAEAMDGENDDLVMSLAIGLWIRDTALKLKAQGINLQKKALTHITGNRGVYTTTENNQNDSWKWDPGSGDKEDLVWLI